MLTGFLNALRSGVGAVFRALGTRVATTWNTARSPSTDALNRVSAWAQILGFPLLMIATVAAVLSVPRDHGPGSVVSPPSGKVTKPPDSGHLRGLPPPTSKADKPVEAGLRVSRLIIDRAQSYFEQEGPGVKTPRDFIRLEAPVEDTWLPGRRWYQMRECHEGIRQAAAANRKCGHGRLLLPVFDVLVEQVAGDAATIRS